MSRAVNILPCIQARQEASVFFGSCPISKRLFSRLRHSQFDLPACTVKFQHYGQFHLLSVQGAQKHHIIGILQGLGPDLGPVVPGFLPSPALHGSMFTSALVKVSRKQSPDYRPFRPQSECQMVSPPHTVIITHGPNWQCLGICL